MPFFSSDRNMRFDISVQFFFFVVKKSVLFKTFFEINIYIYIYNRLFLDFGVHHTYCIEVITFLNTFQNKKKILFIYIILLPYQKLLFTRWLPTNSQR